MLSLPYRFMRFVIEKYSFIQDICEQRIFESQNISLLLKSCISFDNHFGEVDWVIPRKLSSFIVFFPEDQVSSFEYHLQKCSSNYNKEDFVREISLNMEMKWYFVIQIKEIWSAILSLDIRDKIILYIPLFITESFPETLIEVFQEDLRHVYSSRAEFSLFEYYARKMLLL